MAVPLPVPVQTWSEDERINIGPVIECSRQLSEVFRQKGLPVVLVNVAGVAPGRTQPPRPQWAFPDGWTELVPEQANALIELINRKQLNRNR